MAKGLSSRSGPPPDPNALRRDGDSNTWTHLSPIGRQDPAPAWPLTRANAREKAHWEREWARPQALMWEKLGLEVEVAMYCRTLTVAEKPSARVNVRSLVKQQQELLGLSVPGLARNRWIIDQDPTQPKVTVADDPDRSDPKARLRSITGGAAS